MIKCPKHIELKTNNFSLQGQKLYLKGSEQKVGSQIGLNFVI